MNEGQYEVINVENARPIKAWTKGVPFDDNSKQQVMNTAQLPFIYKWIAVMPDVHYGIGATIGSVIPTENAIIPAAVGVDIGCGMMATKTSLSANDLPENLYGIRTAIEKAVPHGMSPRRRRDQGSWHDAPKRSENIWQNLEPIFKEITEKHPVIAKSNNLKHLGTLGTGNHFIEMCLDEEDKVWFMLHSGSRGVGNRIGTYFIDLAKKDMARFYINLPDKNLAYFPEDTEHFDDYVQAVHWAQDFATYNRHIMMANIIDAVSICDGIPPFTADSEIVNCHHNYVAKEHHYGKNVLITRKGAVRARLGDLGIIPGSMGAKSFIVKGKGNEESFHSCSHGAGRVMSRTEAKRRFTVKDQIEATEGVECRKDAHVIDEIPMSYKSIDAVMAAQKDLVDIVHTLKQIVCVKG
ncbi:MAG TPA: RtcB family protein [Spirochaetes bacterium]|nr:RtcB family protein [Spirochaetota bacterium]